MIGVYSYSEHKFSDEVEDPAPPSAPTSMWKGENSSCEFFVSESTICADDQQLEAKTEEEMHDHATNQKMTRKAFQTKQWNDHLDDLLEFRNKYDHCLVPNTFKENQGLANWVKRQRYQYNLFRQNKRSSITIERIRLLSSIGFVWSSREVAWQERLKELLLYKKKHSHCNVPTRCKDNPHLAMWVKSQRRQYKLYQARKVSNMTPARITALENIGFIWRRRRNATLTKTKPYNHLRNNDAPWNETKIFMDVLSDLEDDKSSDSGLSERERTDLSEQDAADSLYDFIPADTNYGIFFDGLSKLPNNQCPEISDLNDD